MHLLPLFGVISGSALINSLIILVIGGLIFWLIIWFVGYAKIPDPFAKVIRVVVGLVALIFLINFLLSLVDRQFIRW